MKRFIYCFLLILAACGCGVSIDPFGPSPPTAAPAAPSVTVDVGLKQLIFSWAEVSGATHYRFHENPDGQSGFTQVGEAIPAGTLSVSLTIAVHLQDFTNALYMVSACNASGCTVSTEISALNVMLSTIGYFKASNTDILDNFGNAVALSANGTTLAVGARQENGNATGINGDQSKSISDAGAVYLFRLNGTAWSQQAYIKASNTGAEDWFGNAVALSADGNTLAVAAMTEDSSATDINGDQSDNSAFQSGAVYVFRFDGTDWFQQAYVKASNTDAEDGFGSAVALSADGNTLAVGAIDEDSAATGIDGDQSDNNAVRSGAVYLFRFDGTDWFQQAYVKASNTGAGDLFGGDVALGADGNTLAVGANLEDSNATGINGDQNNDSVTASGAAYMFRFDGTGWSQQAYVKASNTGGGDSFSIAVALSADGNTLAVGAAPENSNATGINGDQSDNSFIEAGAVYVFRFDGTAWSQQAYVKASNTGAEDWFGSAVTLSADGDTLAVGAFIEDSNATGINGDQNDDSVSHAGAVYVFRFDDTAWSQQSYVKASNTGASDRFGDTITLSADGSTLAVGAAAEDSNATGINGDQSDNAFSSAGAVYLY